MLYALACASLALRQAFAQEYVLPSRPAARVLDVSFSGSKTFPERPHRRLFSIVAPPGCAALYRFFSTLGIDPLVASKLIPFGLGLLTAGFLFGAARRILRSPAVAALATILLCHVFG